MRDRYDQCSFCMHKNHCPCKESAPARAPNATTDSLQLTSMKDFMRVPDIESGKLVWVRASDYFDQGA